MRILFVGDIVGRPGRDALKNHLGHILESRRIDLCIANAENSAAGNGITPRLGEELLGLKIDVLTSGNHIFDKKEVLPYFDQEPRLLRPANYPPSAPGRGLLASQTRNGIPYAVINLQGRVFMPAIDCPFRTCEDTSGLVGNLRSKWFLSIFMRRRRPKNKRWVSISMGGSLRSLERILTCPLRMSRSCREALPTFLIQA